MCYNSDQQRNETKKTEIQLSHELLLPLNMGKEAQYANPDSWNTCIWHFTTQPITSNTAPYNYIVITLSYNSTYQYLAYNIINLNFSSHFCSMKLTQWSVWRLCHVRQRRNTVWVKPPPVSGGSNSQLNILITK